jgi:hypothetical protein
VVCLRRKLKRRHRLRPALVTAVVCGLVTVGSVLVYYTTGALRAWIPNVAASAATIGLTVTIVDSILRSEADQRMRPWAQRTIRDLGNEVRWFAIAVREAYRETHLRTAKPIPLDALDLLTFWLSECGAADVCVVPSRVGSTSPVLDTGFKFASALRRLRSRDIGVLALTPDLVRAIDDCLSDVEAARQLLELSQGEWRENRAGLLMQSEAVTVAAGRAFGLALLKHDPTGRISFDYSAFDLEENDQRHKLRKDRI